MSFQSAVKAVAIGRSTLLRTGRLAGSVTGALLMGTLFASAANSDPSNAGERSIAVARSGDWGLCRQAASDLESRISAPGHLLSAVTLTETGRRGPGGKTIQAWPWTINAGGKGYVFTTKEEAVRAVRRLLAQGQRSIDVGCMQVNLKYHPRAFTSLEEAFDPAANLAYGADFLSRLKRRHGSWELAVQHYHSYTEEHRKRYAARFRKLWALERKRMARADSSPGDKTVKTAALRARSGGVLAELPAAPRSVVRTALPDLDPLRRLKPIAALMAFGVNFEGLGITPESGNRFLQRLTGNYPKIADTRPRSAALSRPLTVN